MGCLKKDQETVVHQLNAFFPEASVTQIDNLLLKACAGSQNKPYMVADFRLAKGFFRPLKTSTAFYPDFWTGLSGALSGLQKDEVGVFQVLFQKVADP